MPTEYAGKRQAATPLRFDELTGGVIDSLKNVAAERQGRRDSDEKIFQDADKEAQATEQFENQTLNTLVENGVDKVRNTYYDLNQQLKSGDITRSQYTARVNATQSGLSMFANTAKTYDETMKNFLSRQQPGADGKPKAGSGLEEYMSSIYADMADLGNKSLAIDPKSGNLYLNKYNEDGTVAERTDVTRINNPGNMIDDRYDLTQSVQQDVKLWKPYKNGTRAWNGAVRTIESVKNNDGFKVAFDAKVQSIIETPRYAASVLTDNGGVDYNFYQTESELDAAIKEKLATAERIKKGALTQEEIDEVTKTTEDRMILITKDPTGTMQPELTDTQNEAVKTFVEAAIDVQLGYSDTTTGGRAPRVVSDNGNGDDDDASGRWATYGTIEGAWQEGNPAKLTARNPKYKFTKTKKGDKYGFIVTLKEGVIGDFDALLEPEQSITLTNARDLAPFMYKTGTKQGDDPYTQFDREKENKQASDKGGSSEQTAEDLINKYK